MKPDWDELGEEFENSKKVVIGDVDCTTDGGKPLCERFGVTGYPTLKYFNPPDQEGEVYEGGRTLAELKKFAKKLGPQCTVDTLGKCSKKAKAELQPYLDMPVEELRTQADEMKATLDKSQKEHDALMEELQARYKASEEANNKLKEELSPKLKLMRAAIPAPKADAPKDEM
uniref:Thioredoxin domain-containing protein n=1 Tax=Prymnesium polylepis TaxID=72548 RepID=A0A6T7ZTB7_9EUKA|mmetsp:Transcript_31974/g.87577  ORF Transcript_31974/g.87577 Transcript_31974/m.87577 type:complete len:172 (+) Transcript_31974:170-685(+)